MGKTHSEVHVFGRPGVHVLGRCPAGSVLGRCPAGAEVTGDRARWDGGMEAFVGGMLRC